MKYRTYHVAPTAREAVKLYGLDDVIVSEMARKSAPFTHEKGDWRFGDFLLDIAGDTVRDFWLLDPEGYGWVARTLDHDEILALYEELGLEITA